MLVWPQKYTLSGMPQNKVWIRSCSYSGRLEIFYIRAMLPPRRRLIIALSSVALGSILAAMFMKQRFGSLQQDNVNQLIFNFIFAAGIVIGIGVLLSKMNKKDDSNRQDNQP